MTQMERFSVYNQLITKPQNTENPLNDLLPDDCDHGWSVART